MIDKKYGRSNQYMVEYCEMLQSIVETKKIVKTGRGKTAIDIEVYKYNKDKDVIKNIADSVNSLVQNQTNVYIEDKNDDSNFKINIITKGIS